MGTALWFKVEVKKAFRSGGLLFIISLVIEPFPLHWPTSYRRVPSGQRKQCLDPIRAHGKDIYYHVMSELMRINAHSLILSTNLPLLEGIPTFAIEPVSQDPGVALWFTWHDQPMVIANDTFKTVRENLYAVGRLITNFRVAYGLGMAQSIERMLAGLRIDPEAFTRTHADEEPFYTPPEPDLAGPRAGWWHVFGFQSIFEASLKEAESRYRQQVHQAHPDRGGSNEAMRIFNEAIEQARQHFGKGKNQ